MKLLPIILTSLILITQKYPQYKVITPQDVISKEMAVIKTIENKEEKLDEYLKMFEKYEVFNELPPLVEDEFTEEEIFLIARCVETEVYERDFDCKVNVASVIFNRLKDDRWGDEVDEIIVPGQFSFWRTEISEDTYDAIRYAWIFGSDAEDALWFHSFSEPIDFYGEHFYSDTAVHHFYH